MRGNKSIKLTGNEERLNANVVVAFEYRYYTQFTPDSKKYYSGIKFFSLSSQEIISYPKIHYDNAVDKDKRTKGFFKYFVRIFKNMNMALVASGHITNSLAKPYFLESLVYNVPDELFLEGNFQNRMVKILNFLQSADLGNFETVCGGHWLCEGNQWNIAQAREFVGALINYWNSS